MVSALVFILSGVYTPFIALAATNLSSAEVAVKTTLMSQHFMKATFSPQIVKSSYFDPHTGDSNINLLVQSICKSVGEASDPEDAARNFSFDNWSDLFRNGAYDVNQHIAEPGTGNHTTIGEIISKASTAMQDTLVTNLQGIKDQYGSGSTGGTGGTTPTATGGATYYHPNESSAKKSYILSLSGKPATPKNDTRCTELCKTAKNKYGVTVDSSDKVNEVAQKINGGGGVTSATLENYADRMFALSLAYFKYADDATAPGSCDSVTSIAEGAMGDLDTEPKISYTLTGFADRLSEVVGGDCVDEIFGSNSTGNDIYGSPEMGALVNGAYADVDSDYNSSHDTVHNDIRAKVKAGLMEMVLQMGFFATQWREDHLKNKSADELKGDPDFQKQLNYIHKAVKDFSSDDMYPILSKFWEYKKDDTDYSLKDLFEEDNVPDEDEEQGLEELGVNAEAPLTQFYKLNSSYGIASLNRNGILNYDTNNPNLTGSAFVQEMLDYQYGITDGVGRTRGYNKKLFDAENAQQMRDHVWDTPTNLDGTVGDITPEQEIVLTENGVDENGYAFSHYAVSLSEYMVNGMASSATFVPMKTNLYEPETLASMDKDGFLQEFYELYGFHRKVLKWDKSATSVMDYYNSGDRLTHNLSVITLQDLLDNCDHDISLYVDDNFYNCAEAVAKSEEVLKTRKGVNTEIADNLTLYEQYDAQVAEASGATQTSAAASASTDAGTRAASMLVRGIDTVLGKQTLTQFLNQNDASAGAVEAKAALTNGLTEIYNYNADALTSDSSLATAEAAHIQKQLSITEDPMINERTLKNKDYEEYDNNIEQTLAKSDNYEYRELPAGTSIENDNFDIAVLPSSMIDDYLDGQSVYTKKVIQDNQVITQTYTAIDDYNPMMSVAFVSALYRDANLFSLANTVAHNTPVFLSSKDMCGLAAEPQWYTNTILNYVFVNNLKAAAQLDYNYVIDLNAPLYIDVFGNILTESGIVVIPAACNATLHTASYYKTNLAIGLYSIYGKSYYLPITVEGAAGAMFPFFTIDKNTGLYIVNGTTVEIGGTTVHYNTVSPFSKEQQAAIFDAYKAYIYKDELTRVNWIAMVHIVNEVMRGAPVQNIDKIDEEATVSSFRNKAAVVSAVKLEQLIKFIKSNGINSILCIPDFTRMEHIEIFVIMAMKLLFVLTTLVVLIGIYRDAAGNTLSLRTFWKSITAIILTFCSVAVIPAIFQLTYYGANKFILQKEVARIMMLNLETQEGGIEIGMTDVTTPDMLQDMTLQLDYIRVPWWKQLEQILYNNALERYEQVKFDAYSQTPIYDHYDVELYNDGVYQNLDVLFKSAIIDYNFNGGSSVEIEENTEDPYTNAKVTGIYVHQNNPVQTAGFYSPYYAFLNSLTQDINAYAYTHNMYNYTTKYMSGNRLKTVGFSEPYFTSIGFMEENKDIMHISDIYGITLDDFDTISPYTAEDQELMKKSYWYCTYGEEYIEKRIDIMNKYARDFVAENHDLLTKVTDETFIKVMALQMAVKYNQLFGIPVANAIDIYNLDSDDLLRLCIAKPEDSMLFSCVSYARFVYTFAGEPGVYMASILEVIMWVGSYVKPLCTIIVFFSVFLSIWVFRVVLQRPSANLWGYLITVGLLCLTNFLHACILKLGCWLPSFGLSSLGCLIFLIVGQVLYLLTLAYVTGVSLKDWSNLGFAEYDREAQKIKSKFGANKLAADNLNGRIQHHEDNWDYYNDLVKQHRERNQ